MEILIATSTATSTILLLTGQGLDLVNFFIQFFTGLGALLAGLVMLLITIVIAQ